MTAQQNHLGTTRQTKAKYAFYIHLSVFVAIATLLTIINLSASSYYLWIMWPLIAWGIGLFFHALKVFVIRLSFS